MDRVMLVRHAEAEGQHRDSPLSRRGLKETAALAEELNNWSCCEAVFSSPFLRAIETIKPFAEGHGLSIRTDERLEERVLSDVPLEDWEEYIEDSFHDREMKVSGGESARDAKERVREFLEDIDSFTYPLLVTHGEILVYILEHFGMEVSFEDWLSFSYPDAILLEKDGDKWKFRRIWHK
ncbi:MULTISPECIES: histidine phosphatase family protein [Salimicrobium]|uniref:Histidine phosphatase family protein n=1 Tax=Salimicrobium humidisoli TaxID=2029857 RepID=A0ABX4HNP6_9BACI|nr:MULTISPECIES: histidine phosphatase family protein [Salimicrobium]PBB04827.1 histidine phosphatase family protein [Salimicrobium humidisoli]